ncbi:MAG TPA: hypothetical protein VK837_12285 [Longimicrobiales bacterium]|nr:hypothetical protein [Longimicrobiales bacterium]
MHTHVRILGWLHLGLGALDLLLAVGVFGLFAGVGALGVLSGDPGAGFAAGGLGLAVGLLVALTAVPNLLAGAGLLARASWARWLALVLGALNAFKFPYGTALAVYTFWVLMNDETKPLFGAA